MEKALSEVYLTERLPVIHNFKFLAKTPFIFCERLFGAVEVVLKGNLGGFWGKGGLSWFIREFREGISILCRTSSQIHALISDSARNSVDVNRNPFFQSM